MGKLYITRLAKLENIASGLVITLRAVPMNVNTATVEKESWVAYGVLSLS